MALDHLKRRDLIAGLTVPFSALVSGGVIGAVVNQLFTRGRTLAEQKNIEAQTERTRAETARILNELPVKTSTSAATVSENVPKGWAKAGSSPLDYDMSIDRSQMFRGKPSCSIRSRNNPRGFGTLMQTFKATSYLGKRVALIGNAKSNAVAESAAFWMRIDGPEHRVLAFDNMFDRPIKGTTDWTKYQVVLDVPNDSINIAFGLLLSGVGQVWMADLNFDVVALSIPSTNLTIREPERPANLSFDE